MRATLLLAFVFAAVGCESAIVGAKCQSGFVRCDDECVNLQRDFRNCGECGNLCQGFICWKGECADDESADASTELDSASE
jgi:hypothetical protein